MYCIYIYIYIYIYIVYTYIYTYIQITSVLKCRSQDKKETNYTHNKLDNTPVLCPTTASSESDVDTCSQSRLLLSL